MIVMLTDFFSLAQYSIIINNTYYLNYILEHQDQKMES